LDVYEHLLTENMVNALFGVEARLHSVCQAFPDTNGFAAVAYRARLASKRNLKSAVVRIFPTPVSQLGACTTLLTRALGCLASVILSTSRRATPAGAPSMEAPCVFI
jgi:hypothetical protein